VDHARDQLLSEPAPSGPHASIEKVLDKRAQETRSQKHRSSQVGISLLVDSPQSLLDSNVWSTSTSTDLEEGRPAEYPTL